MKVRAMLSAKGGKVVTARPDTSVETAIRMLKLEGIGAIVVCAEGGKILADLEGPAEGADKRRRAG